MSIPYPLNAATCQIGIIEDDLLFSNNLATYLLKDNCFSVCMQTNSVKQAIKYLNTPAATIPDVLLLDIHLPGQMGCEAIELLKEFNPTMLVVMLTLEDSQERIHESFANGADGYLLKTESLSGIYTQVINMVQFKQPAISGAAFKTMVPKNKNSSPVISKKLTPKENSIAELVVKGLTNKEIAYQLNLSPNTILYHMKNIYLKLNINTRVELVKCSQKK
jgi:DNA-binding NarL/FixJ family response regulator